MALVDLVARAEGVDPVELNPLYYTIDPDQLDSICDPDTDFQALSFVYEGRTISITAIADGIEISLKETPTPDSANDAVGDAEPSL
jgi:hypothetical protein